MARVAWSDRCGWCQFRRDVAGVAGLYADDVFDNRSYDQLLRSVLFAFQTPSGKIGKRRQPRANKDPRMFREHARIFLLTVLYNICYIIIVLEETIMTATLKITTVGNSIGVILPKEILSRLRVTKGD